MLATVLAIIQNAENRRLNVSGARREQKSDALPSVIDDAHDFNYDAFDDPELSVPSFHRSKGAIFSNDQDDSDEAKQVMISKNDEKVSVRSPMRLASLMELEGRETPFMSDWMQEAKPRLLGDAGCELGVRYLSDLLARNIIPRGASYSTSVSNLTHARNALKNARAGATLSHGAVAQRIGEQAVCIFDPLENPIINVDKAIVQLQEFLGNKTVFLILSDIDAVSDEYLSHIGPICRHFHIPKSHIYIEQNDKTFINYIENANDFVPARLNTDTLSQMQFEQIFDYAQSAYDTEDYDAVLRTLQPLIVPLNRRAHIQKNFPLVQLAQALNLIGTTYRDIGNDDKAVDAFEFSLQLLQEIEDYEDIKSVKANLGITLALSSPITQPKIERAIRHLSEVTQLNPRDDESWVYLANSYLELYRFTYKRSLLNRALNAYRKAFELVPKHDVELCIQALEAQLSSSSAVAASAENQVNASARFNQNVRHFGA